MSPIVCPTVTATNTQDYRQQLEQVQGFARRLHIDFMDGVFAPSRSVKPGVAWWQPGPAVDLHVMYKKPLEILETLISLKPHMIIIHAEANDIDKFLREAEGLGIKLGLALLQDTPTEKITPFIKDIDHALIFSGDLGHFGGEVNLKLLKKVSELKVLKPEIEIGWDGGISDKNILELAQGGVDVFNVGGYIHGADDPEAAYDKLVSEIGV